MKKKHFLCAFLACGVLTFTACSDTDKNSTLSEEPTVDEVKNLPYSSLTPEQQKEKLALEANAFITQMSDLNKEKAIEVFKGFNSCMNISSPFTSEEEDSVDPSPVQHQQPRNVNIKGAEDIVRISSFYGKFTWNSSTQTWDESELTTALVFEFPIGNSTTNNGKIEITGVASSSTIEGSELPKQLTAKIYHGGSQVGSIDVQGEVTVKNDEITAAPTTASASFQMGSYSFIEAFNKADKKATASLKKGDITLMSIAASVSGDIDKAIKDDEDAITGANFSMKLLDGLAIVGSVDIANYNKDIAALEPPMDTNDPNSNYNSSKAQEEYAKKQAEIWNKYWDIYLVSTKDNTKIAKLKNKAVSEERNYSIGVYNPVRGEYEYTTYSYTEWEEITMLQFNDNTEVEAEVYFTEGFDTVMDNFESFMKSFE